MRIALRLVLGLPGLALPSACDSGTPPTTTDAAQLATAATPWFEDVAAHSGLDFRHVRALKQRFWFPEIMGAGLGWLDFDGDGHLDLFVVQSGDLAPDGQSVPGDQLYRSRGDGTFEDATERAGLHDTSYGMGCAIGDYDADGDPDVYVTNVGPNTLYRNDGGTFKDVTASAGVGAPGWSVSAGFFDYDGDGDLDLFVVDYVRWASDREPGCKSTYGELDYCAPSNYNAPSPAVLFRNEGNGTFTDVSKSAGLHAAFGNGLGLALIDFDRDGRLDAYVSNDGMPNQLWSNRGDGQFVDKALLSGSAVNRDGKSEASMGTVSADIDQNGFADLFITNLRGETNTVYLNKGGVFTDRTPSSGIAMASLQYTGFGNGIFDFDLDGHLDLYVANGRVGFWKPFFREDDLYAEPNQLFRGLGGARFEDKSPMGGTKDSLVGTSRGAAFADYDEDGDIDIAYLDNNGPVRLLRNLAAHVGAWTSVRCLAKSGVEAFGAALEARVNGNSIYRDVAACSSYASSNDPRAHFAHPRGSRIDELRVTWPDGTREVFGVLTPQSTHVVKQGSGKPANPRR